MIKLKPLITESLSAHALAEILAKAYVSIFDIDDVSVTRSIYIGPPAFVHSWVNIHMRIIYKGVDYIVANRIVHYKFPPQEKDNLSREEWDDMLVHAEKMPSVRMTKDDIIQKNPLIRYDATVYKNEFHKDTLDAFNMDIIGEVYWTHSLGDLVIKTKAVIDKSGTGDGGDRDNLDKPVAPDADLVPTHNI